MTLHGQKGSEMALTTWLELPPGVYEGANRYSTDAEEVLTLWRAGRTWDVRVKREVERIRTEALQRVRQAFYTDGRLARHYSAHGDAFTADFDAVFEDVMLAAEPGKAEVEAFRVLRRGS